MPLPGRRSGNNITGSVQNNMMTERMTNPIHHAPTHCGSLGLRSVSKFHIILVLIFEKKTVRRLWESYKGSYKCRRLKCVRYLMLGYLGDSERTARVSFYDHSGHKVSSCCFSCCFSSCDSTIQVLHGVSDFVLQQVAHV